MPLLIPMAFLAVFLLCPHKVRFQIRARSYCVRITIVVYILFGSVRIHRKITVFFRKGKGISIRAGRKKEKPLKRGKKAPKGAFGLIKSAKIESIEITGKAGIYQYPYETVLLAGSLRVLASAFAAYLDPKEAFVSVCPEFRYGAFDLKAEGILKVTAGKLMIEALKIKKENKR